VVGSPSSDLPRDRQVDDVNDSRCGPAAGEAHPVPALGHLGRLTPNPSRNGPPERGQGRRVIRGNRRREAGIAGSQSPMSIFRYAANPGSRVIASEPYASAATPPRSPAGRLLRQHQVGGVAAAGPVAELTVQLHRVTLGAVSGRAGAARGGSFPFASCAGGRSGLKSGNSPRHG